MRVLGLVTALLFSCLATICSAQPFDEEFEFEVPNFSGPFGTTIVGNFDGDGIDDIVSLAGGQATVVSAPGLYATQLSIPTTQSVTALALLPDSPRDEILVAHESGLEAWLIASGTGLESRTIGTALWASASAIVVGSDGESIYGLNGDGSMLLTLIDGTEKTIPLPYPGTHLVLSDWKTTNSIDEVAIALQSTVWNGIVVATVAGIPLADFQTVDPIKDLATAYRSDLGVEELIGLGLHPNGLHDSIGIFREGVPPAWIDLVAGSPPVPVLGTAALTTGDTDGDGNDDLVISHTNSREFVHLSGPFPNSPIEIIGSSDSASSTSKPSLLDIDCDGDLDVLQLADDGELEFCHVLLNEPGQSGSPDSILSDSLRPSSTFNYVPRANGEQGYFCFEVDVSRGVPAGATHVEIGFWESKSVGGLWQRAAPIGRITADLSVTPVRPFLTHKFGTLESESVYFWAMRFIENGAVTQNYSRVHPAVIEAFTPVVYTSNSNHPAILELNRLMGGSNFTPSQITLAPADGLFPLVDPVRPSTDTPLPFNTGTNTPVRPLPDPSELPDPRFGETGGQS